MALRPQALKHQSQPTAGERALASFYGLLSHEGANNLGDEIQSLAAAQFLPGIDRLIPREHLNRDPGCDGPIGLLLNGWFMHRPLRWPPHRKIIPFVTSIHLSQHRSDPWQLLSPSRLLLAPWTIGYLRKLAPIGARDEATLALLRRHGIESYHSGCVTLTLPARNEAEVGDRIVACDLDGELLDALSRKTSTPPESVTHTDANTADPIDRFREAVRLLQTYATARSVVTTRLHCALPCLALGTPVLFIPSGEANQAYRQQPALELAQHCSRADFLAGRTRFDPEAPPANPTAFKPFADDLMRRCGAFFGTSSQSWRIPSQLANRNG